ncbi:MAG: hypothetical protein IJP92_16675 [Lachnospiraceae bacterium]|nr:hypothetical protein [Lachnospiraceae bacterium]
MKKRQTEPAAVTVGKVQKNRMYTIREACIVTALGKTCITNQIHKGTIEATRVAIRNRKTTRNKSTEMTL